MTALADGTRAATLAALRDRLERAGIASAASEAETLLLHTLGISRTAFWCDPSTALTPAEIESLESLAARREQREPLQQLIGTVGFHDVTLEMAPGVFIPRPETETLVASVLEVVGALGPGAGPTQGRLLDLGAGSGAISVALLAALPEWTGVAIDRSAAALALTAKNAARNGLGARLQTWNGDFAAFPASPAGGTYDLVVSNPPYIPSGALAGLMPEVRDHDPPEALDGGPDGLGPYRAIARLLPAVLRPEGLLALEIGDDQADAILAIMGPGLGETRVRRDLAGRPRVVLGTWRGGVA